MSTKLIIFDFDGTLADTTATILENYRMAINELGLPARTDAECQATIGIPLKEGFRVLYPDLSEMDLDHAVKIYRQIFNENKQRFIPALFPGVMETLERLHNGGVRMSVASSRSRQSLVDFCENIGISRYFGLILGADDVAHAKPDPEPVLTTLSRLNESADETIVVGDMPVDIAMGSGAGCRTIGVTFGNSSEKDLHEAQATFVIDSFPEIISCINS